MNSRGLTLIECLMALALYSTVLLIIIPCVRGGLELTKREGDLSDRSQEVRLFFEKLSAELENAVPFTPAPFQGHENEIIFISSLPDPEGSQPKLSEIRYWAEEGQLYRTVSDLALSLQDKKDFSTKEKVWIEDLRDLSFEFAYTGEQQSVIWEETWQQEDKTQKTSMPFAVKVRLVLENVETPWEKVLFIPDGIRKTYRA